MKPADFRRVYETHAGATYRFLRRFLGDEAAAEDALQDTFLRVHRAIDGFDLQGRARLSTWILTIARRVALTAVAASARRATQTLIDDGAAAPAPGRRADEVSDLRRALDAAMAALPEAQRAVFVLHEASGLPYEEIAAVEEIDIGTVRSRLHRARAALQERLRAHLDDDDGEDRGHGNGETHARRATKS